MRHKKQWDTFILNWGAWLFTDLSSPRASSALLFICLKQGPSFTKRNITVYWRRLETNDCDHKLIKKLWGNRWTCCRQSRFRPAIYKREPWSKLGMSSTQNPNQVQKHWKPHRESQAETRSCKDGGEHTDSDTQGRSWLGQNRTVSKDKKWEARQNEAEM